jgi:hypothetical protein
MKMKPFWLWEKWEAVDLVGLGDVDGDDDAHAVVGETLEHLHDVEHPERAWQLPKLVVHRLAGKCRLYRRRRHQTSSVNDIRRSRPCIRRYRVALILEERSALIFVSRRY